MNRLVATFKSEPRVRYDALYSYYHCTVEPHKLGTLSHIFWRELKGLIGCIVLNGKKKIGIPRWTIADHEIAADERECLPCVLKMLPRAKNLRPDGTVIIVVQHLIIIKSPFGAKIRKWGGRGDGH